ncbi:MAG TPA: uracil-DNA glycosylase [Pyrinomonadaceae bacterium]|jgi:DNA polymerase|nr:uracil-DNA glycosylase [Pyrinomonadaceae bacterium]
MQSELGKLIADVKENLLYLQELGVSDLSADIDALQAPKQAAQTQERPEPVQAAPPTDLPNPAVSEAKAGKAETTQPAAPARSLRETLEAAKLSRISGPETKPFEISKPPAEKISEKNSMKKETAPEDSLFGDISSTNELAPSEETLENIHRSIAGCKLCRLWEGRTQIVNSTGNPKAQLMFIGEAPGADEDAQGKPFVGRAGQLLTKIIEAIGMNRDDVFIGNINRCRPPGNRAPMADEANTCKPFLLREIAVVRPKVIVVLGATAMQNLLEIKAPIGKLRGNFQDYFGIKVMPTFHPAYLLRDPHKKREVWEDMKKVKAVLDNL